MIVQIKDAATGDMREFPSIKRAAAAYGRTTGGMRKVIDRCEGDPVAIGLQIATPPLNRVPTLGYPSVKDAAIALGVSRVTIWKRRRDGTLRSWSVGL